MKTKGSFYRGVRRGGGALQGVIEREIFTAIYDLFNCLSHPSLSILCGVGPDSFVSSVSIAGVGSPLYE